jgi:hypothetical protein
MVLGFPQGVPNVFKAKNQTDEGFKSALLW